jgi:hypothetical protein
VVHLAAVGVGVDSAAAAVALEGAVHQEIGRCGSLPMQNRNGSG